MTCVEHDIRRKINNFFNSSTITYSLFAFICYLRINNGSFYTHIATSFHTIFWKHVMAKVKDTETMNYTYQHRKTTIKKKKKSVEKQV